MENNTEQVTFKGYLKKKYSKMNELIGAFFVLVVGLALSPFVSQAAAAAANDGNTSAIVAGLYALVPVGWVIGILAISFAVAYSALKN